MSALDLHKMSNEFTFHLGENEQYCYEILEPVTYVMLWKFIFFKTHAFSLKNIFW